MSEGTFARERFPWGPASPPSAQVSVMLPGGTVVFRWYDTMRARNSLPKLEAYNDAWKALSEATDLLAMLAALDDQEVTPKALCDTLRALGYEEVDGER
jgi:hypothetical protein